jgi:hypothetical protein
MKLFKLIISLKKLIYVYTSTKEGSRYRNDGSLAFVLLELRVVHRPFQTPLCVVM